MSAFLAQNIADTDNIGDILFALPNPFIYPLTFILSSTIEGLS